jgi:hypothetical protein
MLLSLGFAFISSGQNLPTESNLASGEIYRLEVPNSGVYEVNYTFLADDLNIPREKITPSNIRILSSGEGVIPENNNTERTFDPVPIPTINIGMEDGTFDSRDKMLFFAPGPEKISVNSNLIVNQRANPYSFVGYVFLQVGGGVPGPNMPGVEVTSTPDNVFSEIQRFSHHEKEFVNLQDLKTSNHGTGQQWFGESFAINRERDFVEELRPEEQLSSISPAHISFRFAARASNTTRVRLSVNGDSRTFSMSGTNISHSEHLVAKEALGNETYSIRSLDNLSLEFLPTSGNDQAWLDYITLNYFTPDLNLDNNSTFILQTQNFEQIEANLNLTNGSQDVEVVNISDFPNYYSVESEVDNGNVKFKDITTGDYERYVALDKDKNYPVPKFIEEVPNQNLKSIEPPQCLVVYKDFLEPAVDRWMNHRKQFSGMKIHKAEVQEVYNEFSGGKLDPSAIRDFARYLYEKGENFEYLVLFGAASFDYRHINENYPDYNHVPTYQTAESYHPIFGFPTDDFFALVKPNQGDDLIGSLSINVGRLPARTLEEAHIMVDKVITYETDRSIRGSWQNRFVFLSDDGDNNIHLRDADNISEDVRSDSSLAIEKIYFDAFNKVNGASGVRFPDATAKLNDAIRRGALVVNYLGHGGPYGWASERVLTNDQIQSWTNRKQLPLFITATCTFGTYDQPALESTGELLINKEAGGAIALFTTSRPVYSSSNRRLTAATFDRLFEKDEHGYITIGEVLTRAKNANYQDTLRANARKYTLLGDPTLRLLLPNFQVITTSFNGQNAQLRGDTIRPLEKVTVQGYIADMNGLPVQEYNGTLFSTLFDKVEQRETLGQSPDSKVRSFKVQENILWKGKIPVSAGQFEFTMTVPKSINEEIGEGKIQYLASPNNIGLQDAKGAYTNFYIGGIPEDTILNPSPPVVDLYLENKMFQNGEEVGPNPMAYITLFDSLGIDLSNNSLGKEMVGILDGNTNEPIILNSFYEPSAEDARKGHIFYPMKNLSPGFHTLKVRAWNIIGLMGEAEIEFFVVDRDENELFEVTAYPNPFYERVCIRLKSQLPVGKYDGFLEIYNSTGQTMEEVPIGFVLESSEIPCIEWSPHSQNSSVQGGGIFYGRIRLEKNDSGDVLHSPVLKLIKI